MAKKKQAKTKTPEKPKTEVNPKHKKKLNLLWIVLIVVVLAVVILFVSKGGNNSESNNSNILTSVPKISVNELYDNKEKYDGKEVQLMNALVSDPLFAVVDRPNASDERLFIEPKKSTYCLYFNLKGKLQKDASGKRDWIFYVDEFECVSKT